jgi:hypothetical protein
MSALVLRWAPWGVIGLCLFVFVAQTISLGGAIGSDTVVFHDAVKRTLADPALLYHDERGVLGTARALQGFLYPPPSIAMLLPIGLGSLEQGHAILSWAALIAAVVSVLAWLTMAQRLDLVSTNRVERTSVIMMMVVTGAVFTCRLGQVDTLILALVTGGVWWAWQGHARRGGMLLAAGGWIKIYPALLLLPLLVRRETRFASMLGFALGGFAILFAAMFIFPLATWSDFFTMLPIMAERTIVNIDNQSIVGVWARTVVPEAQALASYDAIIVPPALRAGVTGAALAAIGAFVWQAYRHQKPQLWVAAAVTAIISLIAPLGWGHSYAYVLPLLALSLATAWRHRRWVQLFVAGLIWVALVIPSHQQFPALSAQDFLWHLAYARYAVAAMMLLGLAWWQMRTVQSVGP